MARPEVGRLPAPAQVFVGGMLGGAVRLAIDAVIAPTGAGVPVDIVVINIVGAFALGVMSGWVARHGQRPWVPLVGTGALGAFTTFSALAALPWMASAWPVVAAVVVLGTLAGAIAAAALGWRLGDRLTTSKPSAARDRL